MIELKQERQAKNQIMEFLAEQGYPRYASLLQNFDVNLTSDPEVIAYVENERARIVINKNLSLEQVSVVIRHELLHRWLKHNYRLGQHVGQDIWDKRTYQQHQIGNIAADYEISNRGYTEEDKKVTRQLHGLVTEDDHPEWAEMSVEEMYDELNKIREQNEKTLEQFLDKLIKSGMYDDFDDNGQEGGRKSTVVDLEDIARSLKSSKETSDTSSEEQKQLNSNVDELIELTENILDEIKDAQVSQGKKEQLQKELINKIRGALQDEKSPEQENSDKSVEEQLKDLAKRLEKEAAAQEKQFNNKDFDRSQIDRSIQLRIEKIADLFDDAAALNSALEESEKAIYASKEKKRKKESKEDIYQANNYDKKLFLRQLDQLIKTQIAREREDTYKVPSKKKLFGANVVLKGKKWAENRNKPKVAVYYDRSGSWQVAWKTKAGDDAISMLNDRYVKKDLIDLEIRYFADTVGDNPKKVGGGNGATQEILDDIAARKVTNVILLTDDNINYGYSRPVIVPGGVFLIFVESQSPILARYLRGKMMNQIYFIDRE